MRYRGRLPTAKKGLGDIAWGDMSWATASNLSNALGYDLTWTPSPSRIYQGAPTYPALPAKPFTLFGNLQWGVPIYQPSYAMVVTAFNVSAQTEKVLNIGTPTASTDPWEYLRSALVASDWDGVAYWYQFWLYSLLQATAPGYDANAFYGLAQLNLVDYKYIVNADGSRRYLPFSSGDVQLFMSKIWTPMGIRKQGSGKISLGHPQGSYTLDPKTDGDIYDWFNFGPNNAGRLRLGFGITDKGTFFDNYWFAAVAAVVTAGVFSALGAALGSSTGSVAGSGTGSTAGSATGGVAAGSTAGSTAGALTSIAADLPEVVITGSVGTGIGAGSVAGGLTAGTIVATSAAPSLTTPSVGAGADLPEVLVTHTVAPTISDATVAAASAAGIVVATTAPAISTAAPSTPAASNDNLLDEVTVTKQIPSSGITVSDALGAGVISAVASPPTLTDSLNVPGNTVDNPQQPTVNTSSNNTLATKLGDLIKQYGIDYVKKNLIKLLTDKYGRAPTQAEIDQANALLNSQFNVVPWLIGGGALAAILIVTRKKKR